VRYRASVNEGMVYDVHLAFDMLDALREEIAVLLSHTSAATPRFAKVDAAMQVLRQIERAEPPECVRAIAIRAKTWHAARRHQKPSHNMRRNNAVAVLYAARDVCDAWLENLPPSDKRNKHAVTGFVAALNDVIDLAETVKFPRPISGEDYQLGERHETFTYGSAKCARR